MMNVWCFELQIRQNLLLRQSMLCPSAVETEFLFESISLRSSAFLLTRTDQLYDLVCHSKYVYEGGGGRGGWFCSFVWKHLPFFVFNYYLTCFSAHLLNESTSFAKPHSCQLLSSLTRYPLYLHQAVCLKSTSHSH